MEEKIKLSRIYIISTLVMIAVGIAAVLMAFTGDPQRGFLLTGGSANADELYATRDGGDQWRRVSLEETALPAETVVVDRAGRLLVGSER